LEELARHGAAAAGLRFINAVVDIEKDMKNFPPKES